MALTTDTFYVVSCDKCGANSLIHWAKVDRDKTLNNDTRAIVRHAGFWCSNQARMVPYFDHSFNTIRCRVEWDVLCMKCHDERKDANVIRLKRA
jgi:ribosomal protein L44E